MRTQFVYLTTTVPEAVIFVMVLHDDELCGRS
jgi:hypothetical protein